MHIATVTSKKNRKLKTKMSQPFSSALLENAVNEFAKLPGIGRKTALRLVLHLLRQEEESVETFGNTIIQLRKEIKYCQICHNISDSDICALCNDATRDDSTICVVENIKEVMVVENTRQFRGRYHVLGGVISPMDGVGPSDLRNRFFSNPSSCRRNKRSYPCTKCNYGRRYY